MTSFIRSAALLATLLSFIPSPTYAQDAPFNSTAYEQCQGTFEDYKTDRPVNSTGRVAFRFDPILGLSAEDYYISLTLEDTRQKRDQYSTHDREVIHSIQTWLSVPENAKGNLCLYHFRAQNASASGTGMDGCEGVLSQKCHDALLNATVDLSSVTEQDRSCPRFDVTDSLKEECGSIFTTEYVQEPEVLSNCKSPKHHNLECVLSTQTRAYFALAVKMLNISSEDCTVSRPASMSMPGDMRTYSMLRRNATGDFSDKLDTFDWYDRSVLQTHPFLAVVSDLWDARADYSGLGDDYLDKRVVCVAPSNVAEGSRVPELKFGTSEGGEGNGNNEGSENGGDKEDDKSAASHTSWGPAAQLAVYAAAAVGLVFVFN
jgi:hypothetical protein